MIQNKITIDGKEFEIEEIPFFFPQISETTPTINFNNKFYIGKAIPNKPDKDYEILSFINTGGDIFELTDGYWYKQKKSRFIDTDKWRTAEHLLSYAINCKIHSVKRLSDDEVFTIGDRINYKDHGNTNDFLIRGFEVKGETIWVFENIEAGYGCILDRVVKYKQRIPLFYADAGDTPIYDQQQYYWVGYPVNEITHKIAHRGITYNFSEEQRVFSTFEKSKDYVLLNKADKSINDVLNLFDKSRSFVGIDFLKERLIGLTKEKLNK